ncbi:hypothetical protein ACFV6G_08455 [Streptomyces lavendulae]|uniref:hypothetical protein n=1 Tax=Streptomyces lavendulae TaxID=1914 RepID=UPI003692775D
MNVRAGAAVIRGTGGRWLGVALTVSAVLASGCTASVGPDELAGLYRNDRTGGELLLGSDGKFSATHVSTDRSSDPADFHGRWEFLDNQASNDFVYLTVEDDGLGKTAGIQLYPIGRGAVEFRPDPDGKPMPKLTKAATP